MALLMCNKVKQHWILFTPGKFVAVLLTFLCWTFFTSGRKKSFSQVKGVNSSLPQRLVQFETAASATLLSQSGYCWLSSRLPYLVKRTDEVAAMINIHRNKVVTLVDKSWAAGFYHTWAFLVNLLWFLVSAGPVHVHNPGTIIFSLLSQFSGQVGPTIEGGIKAETGDERGCPMFQPAPSPSIHISEEERSQESDSIFFPFQEQGKDSHVSKEEVLWCISKLSEMLQWWL